MPASSAATEIMKTPRSVSKNFFLRSSARRPARPSGVPVSSFLFAAISAPHPRACQEVTARVAVHHLGELLDRVPLLFVQRLRDLDPEAIVDVSTPAPGKLWRPLSAQALERAVARPGGHPNPLRAVERRHLDRSALDSLDDRDRHLDLEIVALPLEDRRRAH